MNVSITEDDLQLVPHDTVTMEQSPLYRGVKSVTGRLEILYNYVSYFIALPCQVYLAYLFRANYVT